MNEGLMGLEQHEGEYLVTKWSYLGQLSLQNCQLKGQFTPKCKFYHYLLTLKLFRTCMNFFVLLNKNDVTLKNACNLPVPTDFHGMEKHTMRVNGDSIRAFSFLGELSL